MVCVGFSTGTAVPQFVDNTPLWSIGAFFDIFAAAAFIHLTLAFPSGRLRSTRERVLVVAGYAIALGLQVAKLMFLGAVPQNGFALRDDFDTYRTIERVQLYSISVICLAAAALLLGRWVATGRPGRIWPTALVGFFALGLVGARAALRLRRVRLAGRSWRSSAPPWASSASRRSCSSSECSTPAWPAAG